MKAQRFAAILMATTSILLLLSLGCTTHAKEIVATKEWQVVGENDTIPAGLHVRMDMTTGGKWAKLIDENDNDTTDSVQILSDGSVRSSSTAAVAVVAESDNGNKEQTAHKPIEPKYDYNMMHRTLSNLPSEEQERMGGLPELPGGMTSTLTSKEDRLVFEAQMKDLWDRRQAELAEFQENTVMDMPKVLQDRIQRIRAYLDDPHTHLIELLQKKDDDEKDKNKVTDISSVLLDLEYQLTDVDMTRDFHTMGGWPLLVSFLSNDVHVVNDNSTTTEEITNLIHQVQLQAAWAIGTAVKNTGEFFPFATEEVTLQDGKATTALELLLQQLSQSSSDVEDDAMVRKKRQKIVYAIGGLLRGNRVGQLYFLNIDGPSQLSKELQGLLETRNSDMSLVKRIIALAGDVISDVVLHGDEGDHKAIIASFSSDAYCQSCLDSLIDKESSTRSMKETTIRALQVLAPFCRDWDKEVAALAVVKVKQAWQVEPDMDHEVRRELLDLVSDTVDRIREKKAD